MTELKELSLLLDGYNLRQIEVLTRAPRSETLETRYTTMFRALEDGQIQRIRRRKTFRNGGS